VYFPLAEEEDAAWLESVKKFKIHGSTLGYEFHFETGGSPGEPYRGWFYDILPRGAEITIEPQGGVYLNDEGNIILRDPEQLFREFDSILRSIRVSPSIKGEIRW